MEILYFEEASKIWRSRFHFAGKFREISYITFNWNLYLFFFVLIWPLLPSLFFPAVKYFWPIFLGLPDSACIAHWVIPHSFHSVTLRKALKSGSPTDLKWVGNEAWTCLGNLTKKSPIRSSIACSPQATKKPQPGCDLNSSKTGFRSSSSSSASARELSAWLSYQDDPSQTWIKPMCHVHKHVDTC